MWLGGFLVEIQRLEPQWPLRLKLRASMTFGGLLEGILSCEVFHALL